MDLFFLRMFFFSTVLASTCLGSSNTDTGFFVPSFFVGAEAFFWEGIMKLVWVEDCSEEEGIDSFVAFTVLALGF